MVPACIGHMKKTLRLVVENAPTIRSWARTAVMRTPEEPINGTSVHCAENAAFSGSKRTPRTIVGAHGGDARTGGANQWYQCASGMCRKRSL